MKLSGKQKLFALAYIGKAKFNATLAAEIAGYRTTNRQTLTVIGHENLRKPNIRKFIDIETDRVLKDAGYDVARLTKLLLDILYADPKDFVRQDDDGNFQVVFDPENQPTIALSEIHTKKDINRESKYHESYVTRLKFYDKKWAAEMLSKLLEMKSGDTNIKGTMTFNEWFKERRAIEQAEEQEKADNESD